MIEIIGETGTQKLGIARSDLISNVRNVDGGWTFRRCRDRQIHELINMIEDHELAENQNAHDVILWRKTETEYSKHFSTAATWQLIRTQGTAQDWSKVVWFQLGVPRFAFITWLAIKNRLSTGDLMQTWGQTQGCLFCGELGITSTLPALIPTLFGLRLLVHC